jgi:hypothetical protein
MRRPNHSDGTDREAGMCQDLVYMCVRVDHKMLEKVHRTHHPPQLMHVRVISGFVSNGKKKIGRQMSDMQKDV